MASILKGAPVVAAMNERNAALCEQLKTKGIVPTLAVVRVGAREDDLSYERGVMTRCGKVGVEVKQYLLPADAAQDDLLKVIAEINANDAIHGCLLFRPLPKQFDDRTVRAALAPEKDIDGITDGSLAGVFTNTDLGYAPCTAQACLEILKHYNVPLSGKRAVVVGRSLVVGKPAAMMLDRENATVTICNSRTQDLPQICQEADVVVVAMGRMGAVGADCLRPGQTVVDVGIHLNDEGKLMGLPLNRALGDYDVIAGTFFVCGYNEENFVGLTPEQFTRYEKFYHDPQLFHRTPFGILVEHCTTERYAAAMDAVSRPRRPPSRQAPER